MALTDATELRLPRATCLALGNLYLLSTSEKAPVMGQRRGESLIRRKEVVEEENILHQE